MEENYNISELIAQKLSGLIDENDEKDEEGLVCFSNRTSPNFKSQPKSKNLNGGAEVPLIGNPDNISLSSDDASEA